MEECGRFEVWYHLPLGGGGWLVGALMRLGDLIV